MTIIMKMPINVLYKILIFYNISENYLFIY